ncbi:hypothetical protein EDC04DRAFT_2863935 [Pisolithus marmoratus]|nr:hypothetical protein EDC04DRAFT_2863935 [Pisolithus marmoratus]
MSLDDHVTLAGCLACRPYAVVQPLFTSVHQMITSNKTTPTKFYQEDIVRRNDSPNVLGVVLRCWHDAEDLPIAGPIMDPLMRPLKRGEVGVSFFPGGVREIVSEADYTLVDRTFQTGDYCKRSIDDVCSGVVVSTEVQAKLVHAITDEPVEGWKDVKDLRHSTSINGGDYVVYDDWIGQLFDELVVSASGILVRIPEISTRLTIGDKGIDLLPGPIGHQAAYSGCRGVPIPTPNDTVVDVKHTVIAICWLAVNQSLDPEVAQSKRRPERFWYGDQLSKLTVIRSKSGDIRVGDKVVLENGQNIPTIVYDAGGAINDKIVIRTLCVKETRTVVMVLWQDGTSETLSSTELIPYLNIDEYDCWPGDHVLWKSEDQARVAVVQSVDSADRVALIRCLDAGTLETVSVLELDPNGAGDLGGNILHNYGLGVRRGDSVFIHREGTTNGFDSPKVPKIGEIEEWVREHPIRDDGELGGWRRTMADLGARLATEHGIQRPQLHDVKLPKGDRSLMWFGEVTELRLDGSVEVTHPNEEVSVLPLERLTRLYDSLEQIEDDGWDDEISSHNSHSDYPDGVWLQDDDGIWRYDQGEDGDEWEEMDDHIGGAMEIDIPWAEDEPSAALDDLIDSLPRSVTPDVADSISPLPVSPSTTTPDASQEMNIGGDEESCLWKLFDVLPCAPPDHAFYTTPCSQPSKAFLARVTKEYRALSNSLPESILVRAYEDRTDLLRSIPHTENAPFVIDWMLDSNFPHTPPIAHFHSWTNGNGRINPNLYEEGKVCLSILGTWSGDRTETWSATRSSLLQAFVSIQGLVLVKEPWFCEPAYDKLRGTDEGMVNSRLYNEKAYVLSRGFVRRALEMPPGGLQTELTWLYYTKGKLAEVLWDSRQLIEKSKQTDSSSISTLGDCQDVSVPRLTAGGIITLERTLTRLQNLLDNWQARDSSRQ